MPTPQPMAVHSPQDFCKLRVGVALMFSGPGLLSSPHLLERTTSTELQLIQDDLVKFAEDVEKAAPKAHGVLPPKWLLSLYYFFLIISFSHLSMDLTSKCNLESVFPHTEAAPFWRQMLNPAAGCVHRLTIRHTSTWSCMARKLEPRGKAKLSGAHLTYCSAFPPASPSATAVAGTLGIPPWANSRICLQLPVRPCLGLVALFWSCCLSSGRILVVMHNSDCCF